MKVEIDGKKHYTMGAVVATCANHPESKFVEMVRTKNGYTCPVLWHKIVAESTQSNPKTK